MQQVSRPVKQITMGLRTYKENNFQNRKRQAGRQAGREPSKHSKTDRETDRQKDRQDWWHFWRHNNCFQTCRHSKKYTDRPSHLEAKTVKTPLNSFGGHSLLGRAYQQDSLESGVCQGTQGNRS